MGYEVHITRKENWSDEGPEISLAEWLEFVANDPEMRNDGYAEAIVGGGSVLRIDDSSMSVWTAYSQHLQDENMAWMWHCQGNVVAKNPDREILQKMADIARQLSAKVQGDEGEVYGSDGQLFSESKFCSRQTSKPWWRFW